MCLTDFHVMFPPYPAPHFSTRSDGTDLRHAIKRLQYMLLFGPLSI